MEGSIVRIRLMSYISAAVVLALALIATAYAQQAQPAQQDQQQQGRGGGRGGRGQRGPAVPAAPTPRRSDGKPWVGSVPGQKPGRWNGGPTTLPLNMLDKVPFQPWSRAVYDQR